MEQTYLTTKPGILFIKRSNKLHETQLPIVSVYFTEVETEQFSLSVLVEFGAV